MKASLFLFFFLSSVQLCLGNAWAQEGARLPEIVVRDSGDSGEQAAASQQTHVRLADYSHRIVTLPEVVAQQPGVHLTRYGGLEDSTSISIRGSSPDEVLVFLDGLPLNTAQGGGVDLSLIPEFGLDSLDIHRGTGPLNLGYSTSAGSVSLHSSRIKKGTHARGLVEYGSYQTVKGAASVSHRGPRWGFLLSQSVTSTEGDFAFLDNNGTPFNRADDRTVARRNNATFRVHPFLKLSYDFDERAGMEGMVHFIRRSSGVPGFSTNQSQSAHLSETQWLASLRFRKDHFFHENLSWENLSFFRAYKSQYDDLRGEIGLGGAQDNDTDTVLFGDKINLEWRWGKHQTVNVFSLYQMERFAPQDFLAADTMGPTSVRHRLNAGLGNEIRLFGDRLFLSPAIWMENIYNSLNSEDPSVAGSGGFLNSRTHHVWSAKMGASGALTPYLSLEGHVGRGIRFPTFPELFGDRGGLAGNPLLDPQKSLNWDLGLRAKKKPPCPVAGAGSGLRFLLRPVRERSDPVPVGCRLCPC